MEVKICKRLDCYRYIAKKHRSDRTKSTGEYNKGDYCSQYCANVVNGKVPKKKLNEVTTRTMSATDQWLMGVKR